MRCCKMNVHQLIGEVHQRRPLWDRMHEMRHERPLIEALWDEVAIVMGQPTKNVKSKWKTLKDTYRKEAKKAANDPTYQPPWAYYHLLTFLYGQLGIENNADVLPEQSSPTSIVESESKIEFVYENIELPVNNVENIPSFSKGTKRKLNDVDYMHEYYNKEFLDDEDMCFFKSLIPHIKQLSPQRKMLMRMKIQELIYNEVYSSDL